MSNCMTFADETIDQKDTRTDITPKDVVDFILEEALLSAFVVSDKDKIYVELCKKINGKKCLGSEISVSNRIGDFNITEEFRQRDQLAHVKDFEQVDHSQSTETQESNLNSGEIVDRSARENLELLIDSFVKKEEKLKPAGEYTVLTEEVLANNELQIQNGQIRLEKNKKDEEQSDRRNYFSKEDVVKDEKIEIEYFNEGKLNKIYVPLNPAGGADAEGASAPEEKEQGEAEEAQKHPDSEEDPGRPFEPFTTEELRQSTLQVWGKESSTLVGKWEGDASARKEEAVRLMEELSSVHVYPDSSTDPNRPRACAFAEEDVKKMIREIEEISFTQCHANFDDFDVAYHPDGQGDADLESKSFTKSDDNIAKPQMHENQQDEFCPRAKSSDDVSEERVISGEGEPVAPEDACSAPPGSTMENAPESARRENDFSIGGQLTQQYEAAAEKSRANSSSYNGSTTRMTSSLEGMLDPRPSERGRLQAVDGPSSGSLLMSRKEHKTSEIFLTNSESLKDSQNDMGAYDEFFPESMSLSGNTGSLSGSKLDEFALRNVDFTSELDIRAFQGKRSDVTRGSRSVNNTQENASELNNQGTSSLGRLAAAGSETYKRLDPDSFSKEKDSNLVPMETSVFVKKSEEMRKSQDAGNFLQGSELSVQMAKNEEESRLIREGVGEKLEEATKCMKSDADNFECRDAEAAGSEVMTMEAEEEALATEDAVLNQNFASCYDSNKSLSKAENSSNSEGLASSRRPSRGKLSSESLEEDGSSDTCNFATQKFKLQSQKMYLGTNYELAGQSPNEFTLTESEEAFIDMTESVIQIIDPPENNVEEESNNSSKISFSLLSEVQNLKTLSHSVDHGPRISLGNIESSDVENPTKRVYSGMTTIGPIKNVEYDPKDLTAPEIDFGKMTRITSSRQLANDIGLFNPDVTTIKIVEEDDPEENASLNIDVDRLERTSLVNRDIASLTKVQKIREVMSYQPKSEEDFEDEEVLARPRLDLKDVESMTDERYKVPDVGIPLLSFEIGESELSTEKEIMESMSLVISGLANPTYYDEEMEDDNLRIQENTCEPDVEHKRSEQELERKNSSKTMTKEAEGDVTIISWEKESKSKLEAGKESEKEIGETQKVSNGSQLEGVFGHQKYGTLGSVFKKASSRLMRKDGDLFVRNSKSLPRDASRTSATDSIRSMLDDCQSSASNILKKSRSLLKNTQSVFKSISQGRVSPDSGAGRSADQKKPFSPSEPDVTAMEKKFSGFLKKEDFTKAKNLIKGKVEKALKSMDLGSLAGSEPEVLPEERDLRVAVINKEDLRVDRMENFKKLLPKTPLVYKSQFVKSQMNVQSNPSESMAAPANVGEGEDQKVVTLNDSVFEGNSDKIPDQELEVQQQADPGKEIQREEKLQWVCSQENVKSITNEDAEPKQPDFIIMETVQGLPAGSDLESPSSEKENLNVDNDGEIEIEKEGKETASKKTTETSSSLPTVADGGRDVAPCFPEVDDEKAVTKSPSERKIKTKKKKKLTARFRSFWSSAFGRVKTPPAKADLS